ncbi:hypothetical protein D3C84_756750 [compost metagenome]
MRRLPLRQPAERLRPRCRQLPHHLERDGGGLPELPRAGRAAYRLGQTARRAGNGQAHRRRHGPGGRLPWRWPRLRGGAVRALPQSPREPGRRQCTGPAAARRHAPDHAVRRPLPRRRADPRRGVRVRLLRAEQDVRHGCDLPRLPRAALRPSARRGQCAVRRLPQPAGQSALPQPAEEVLRRSFPPFPPGRQPRRTVRQLSHPDAHLHGGGRPPRPQLPRPASRSGRAQRRAGCLHRLSSGS